tara:strand:- start:64 stop:516 length:453 start_codon:yes stop_codon:yes gene_type:complete
VKKNIDFIIFALKQLKAAENFGFTRNEANRNLKLALNHYWQAKELGIHIFRKHKLKKTKAASKTSIENTEVEHAVPAQVIVDMLMSLKKFETNNVEKILKKYWRVILVTKNEHKKLNNKKLKIRSSMPKDWKKKYSMDPMARYKLAKIKF